MKNYNEILNNIINYENMISNNEHTKVFKIDKLNNLVYYLKQRNLNIDILDIKADMIAEIIRVVKENDTLGDFDTEQCKFINLLCRIIYNNICFRYKKTNNMYSEYRYQDSINDDNFLKEIESNDSFNSNKSDEDFNYIELMKKPHSVEEEVKNDNIYIYFIDFLIKNKEFILDNAEICLLNEMLYDIEKSNVCTKFSKKSISLLKDVLDGDTHKIHNKVNALIIKIKRKFSVWEALLHIIEKNDYSKALELLYSDCNINSLYTKDIYKYKDNIILILEYRLYNHNYIKSKYLEFNKVKSIEMKMYYIKKVIFKNIAV